MRQLRFAFIAMILLLITINTADHGYGYLIRVINQTQFPARLLRPHAPITDLENVGGRIIPPGGILGERISAADAMMNPTEMGKAKLYKLTSHPLVTGFGIQEVPNFTVGSVLIINPLYGKGAAWLDKKIVPLNTTLEFKVKAPDRAEAHVVFGEKVNEKYEWRIILGAQGNTKTVIMKDNKVVAESLVRDFPQSALEPGVYKPFWLSVDEGFITLGLGKPGQDIFLAWQDAKPSKSVSRVGFGCNEIQTRFTEIQLGPPVKARLPERVLMQQEDGKLKDFVFREPGVGAISYGCPKSGDCSVIFKNDLFPEKKCVVSRRGEAITVKMHPKDPSVPDKEIFISGSEKNVWLSINGSTMIVGQGELGTRNEKALSVVSNDFFEAASRAEVSDNAFDVRLSTLVQMKQDIKKGASRRAMFDGLIRIVAPFAVQFKQNGQVVEGHDLIGKQTHFLGKTPQQEAAYFFDLTIKRDGSPRLKWQVNPVNTKVFFMKAAGFALRLIEGILYMGADRIGEDTSGEVSIDISRAFASGAMAGVGAATRLGSAALEAETQFGYRHEKAHVYLEQMVGQKGKGGVPSQAKVHRNAVEQKLRLVAKTTPYTRKDFDFLLSTYQEIIALTTHPHVVGRKAIKKQIYASVKKLFEMRNVITKKITYRYRQLVETTKRTVAWGILKLLISALKNDYLASEKIDWEARERVRWRSWLSTLSREFFELRTTDDVVIPATYSEYLDFGKRFEKGNGSLAFQARGPGNFFIGFAKPGKVIKRDTELYEFVLGANGNTETHIRSRHLAKPVAVISQEDSPAAGLNAFDYAKYWISMKNGVLSVGRGNWGQNTIISWKDPYPESGTFSVFFASWNAPVEMRDIHVGPPVEDLTPETIAKIREKDRKVLQAAREKTETVDLESIKKEAEMKEEARRLDMGLLQKQDVFKYDELELAAMEMKYDDLMYEDLAWEAMKRMKGEVITTLQEEPKTEEKEEKDVKTEEAKERLVERGRRGAVARERAMGMTMVLQTPKMLMGEIEQLKSTVASVLRLGKKAWTRMRKYRSKRKVRKGQKGLKKAKKKLKKAKTPAEQEQAKKDIQKAYKAAYKKPTDAPEPKKEGWLDRPLSDSITNELRQFIKFFDLRKSSRYEMTSVRDPKTGKIKRVVKRDDQGRPVTKYRRKDGQIVYQLARDRETGELIMKDGKPVYQKDAKGRLVPETDSGAEASVWAKAGRELADLKDFLKFREKGIYEMVPVREEKLKEDDEEGDFRGSDAPGRTLMRRDQARRFEKVRKVKLVPLKDKYGKKVLKRKRERDSFGDIIYQAQRDTETGQVMYQKDKDGNPVYQVLRDNDGKPIYERDDSGKIVRDEKENPKVAYKKDPETGEPLKEPVYKLDEYGNKVPEFEYMKKIESKEILPDGQVRIEYEKDKDGNPILVRDKNGNPIPELADNASAWMRLKRQVELHEAAEEEASLVKRAGQLLGKGALAAIKAPFKSALKGTSGKEKWTIIGVGIPLTAAGIFFGAMAGGEDIELITPGENIPIPEEVEEKEEASPEMRGSYIRSMRPMD
ncbi:hypothetical protein ACFLY6_00835 [Candidatus Dependentiae bacterium]